jgi:hypothetical protein
MLREFGVKLVQQAGDLRFGGRLHLGRARRVSRRYPALRVEIDDQRGLQRVGQPHQPLVEMRAVHAAQWRRQTGIGVRVAQVQHDGRRLVEHQLRAARVVLRQNRNQAVGVELQVRRRLVGIDRSVTSTRW